QNASSACTIGLAVAKKRPLTSRGSSVTTPKAEDIRNVAVVGHKGSGKTSLIEAMLYLAKVAPRRGKPGDRACGLDDSPEEQSHMSTLETRLVTLPWAGKKINILDTPGDASLMSDTRMALAAADSIILVVSAKAGVEIGTERICRYVQENHLPCLVVLTKVDDEHAQLEEVVADIRALKAPVTLIEVPAGVGPQFHGVVDVETGKAWVGKPEAPTEVQGGAIPDEVRKQFDEIRAKLVDDVAATDDELTDHYLTAGDLTQQELDAGVRKAVASAKLVPVYYVSSSVPSGVVALLNGIVDLLPSPAQRPAWKGALPNKTEAERSPTAEAPVSALVFKTRIDPHAGRTSCLRVLSGVLRPDAQLVCAKD